LDNFNVVGTHQSEISTVLETKSPVFGIPGCDQEDNDQQVILVKADFPQQEDQGQVIFQFHRLLVVDRDIM
jgi:hypothetical protein